MVCMLGARRGRLPPILGVGRNPLFSNIAPIFIVSGQRSVMIHYLESKKIVFCVIFMGSLLLRIY